MKNLSKTFILLTVFFLMTGLFSNWHLPTAKAQTKPLTYPEVITALNTKLPNSAFKNKTALIDYLITQIRQRKVEKSLSQETESILRQSGATDELIDVIKANAPSSSKPIQSQTFTKTYAEMSEVEKRQFIEVKANEFLDRFGRTDADKISAQGLDLIKSSVDAYLKRLSVDEKTIGNSDGMVSKNSCNFARGNLTSVLKRGSGYSATIKESFENKGVQPELGIYVAFIESEFCPCIQAPTGPLGMFQLTRAVARNYGLNVVEGASPTNPDERCNPKSASLVAASYIKMVIDRFYGKDVNGVLFTVAAYNSGEGGLNRSIKTIRELNKNNNITFWDLVAAKDKLSQQFQNENYLYVPKFLAAAIIGENPKSFGIVEFEPLMPFVKIANNDLDYWVKQRNKALEPRKQPTGIDVKGVVVPPELTGVSKQWTNLDRMKSQGYAPAMDFFDLAEKSLSKELTEVPFVTETYLLDVGGNANDSPFTKFTFKDGVATPLPDSPEFKKLTQLADDFNGQKYDLNNPRDRKQMRMRLLRMLHPQAKAVLEEIAQKYHEKFGRPLRITSLVRSIDYQIELNKTDASTFIVREGGRIPPHCSGLAFDFAYKHLTAEEQNFLLGIMAQMEKEGKIDAMRESGINAALHIFVF